MNKTIIEWFTLLVKQLEFFVDVKTGKAKLIYSYKLKTIKNALRIISNVKFKIKSGNDVANYKGIGKGIIDRINEIISTGKLKEVNQQYISSRHLKYIDELMSIFGIGRVKAYELYTKHNIKTIDELKKAIKKKNVVLPDYILKGLKYVAKIKYGIPRSEMIAMYSKIINCGIEFDPDMDITFCGSYRREANFSNDIDIIISHPKIITKKQAEKTDLMHRFIQYLKEVDFVKDSFTSTDVSTKYMGVCKLNSKTHYRRIDIRYISQESYYTALLYFTGSGDFNRRMRSVALSMNYTLNEYSLTDDKNRPLKITSEKDIFDHLNMEYLQPNQRI